jgi:fructokinase
MMIIDEKSRPCIFGEVLFDRFPDGAEVLGGAPFNVAWHLQAFASAPLFVSRVGDDDLGARIRSQMHRWDMNSAALQTDSDHATGTVDITLENNEPRYDIVANAAYDFLDADTVPLQNIGMVYHGSLALRADNNRAVLRSIKQKSAAPVFLDVNLRDPWWNEHDVLQYMSEANWVKLNADELAILSADEEGLQEQGRSVVSRHKLDMVIITLGEDGAMAMDSDGVIVQVRPKSKVDIVDTVGAGDAFASVCMLGIQHGWQIESILERAQDFAATIVGIRGATIDNIDFYRPFLRQWNIKSPANTSDD